jgi:hypothetical protein
MTKSKCEKYLRENRTDALFDVANIVYPGCIVEKCEFMGRRDSRVYVDTDTGHNWYYPTSPQKLDQRISLQADFLCAVNKRLNDCTTAMDGVVFLTESLNALRSAEDTLIAFMELHGLYE